MELTPEDLRAQFCADLPALRRLTRGAAGQRRRAELERIARAARQGEDITPLLVAAGLLVPDDEDALLAAGAPPHDSERSGSRFPLPTAVGGPGRPVSGDYVCPDGGCSRVERRGPSEPVPECEVHRRALRLMADD
ncbi:hypothetical protein [Streptomyces sp. 6N223]|uniref:hypothetical protein n=1 Tax=Streptomyces sp. 6N223 TaxID=3457412 RepID=UPI003FD464C1